VGAGEITTQPKQGRQAMPISSLSILLYARIKHFICVILPKVTEASGYLDIYGLLLMLWQMILPKTFANVIKTTKSAIPRTNASRLFDIYEFLPSLPFQGRWQPRPVLAWQNSATKRRPEDQRLLEGDPESGASAIKNFLFSSSLTARQK
jgi:hypothetical protein